MRLIDADSIKYRYAKLKLADGTETHGYFAFVTSLEIEEAPTIEAEPVVRCRECNSYNGHRYCTYLDETVLDDDFCSYGERREDNGVD